MRSLLLTLVIILSISFKMAAQVMPMPTILQPLPTQSNDDPGTEKKSFGQRLVFGGSIGAQFGTNTQVNISPIIGYRVTDKFTSGVGITYIFYKYKYLVDTSQFITYPPITFTEKDHIFGISLWNQYRIIPQAFLHIEPGFLNLSVPKLNNAYDYGATYRKNIYTFLVGGGYYQSLGSNAGIQFSILWDLIEDQYSPYNNPIIRIGFVAGF